MSLLMDALKKAEAAKRQASQGEGFASDEQAQPASAEPGQPLPELPRELSLLDDQFTAAPGTPRPAARGPQQLGGSVANEAQRERDAAHNLFAAKRSPSRAPFWIGLTAVTLVAVAASGGWLWWQLQPPAGGLRAGPALADRSAQPPQPAAKPAPPMPQPAQVADAVVEPKTGASGTALVDRPLSSQKPAAIAAQRVPANPAQTVATADPTRAGRMSAIVRNETADESIGIRARRTANRVDAISPAVAQGFASYNAGDLANAKRHYEDALRLDPRSLDALNGMAAVALRAGRRDVAETYLGRALEVDPKDAFALSTQATLKSQSDPYAAESRLKALVAASPESAAAHFALGNLYAHQGRWSEAQQSYFRAYTSEPENPDFLFNLAVSLDHLRQSRLALQYYQSAVSAGRTGAFDREQVAARMRELQPAP